MVPTRNLTLALALTITLIPTPTPTLTLVEGDWWGQRDSVRESIRSEAGMSDEDFSQLGNSIVSGTGVPGRATTTATTAAAAAAAETGEEFDEHVCPLRLRNKGHEPNLVLKDNDLNFKLRLQKSQSYGGLKALCDQRLTPPSNHHARR